MIDLLPLLAFGAAALCALLSALARRSGDFLRLIAGLGLVLGALSALALGWPLERLRGPVLAVCAASLISLRFGRGSGA